jgi:hypothetical protein
VYDQGFYITGEYGNNAFSFEKRGEGARIFVPTVIDGSLDDLELGDEVAFEDFDEHGVKQSCKGLKHFVRTELWGVPAVIFDNHNHAFYFWWEALERGLIEKGAALVHVDQHKDMRGAAEPYCGAALKDVFDYTNQVLNVGNYIQPAIECGLIGEVQLVTSEVELQNHEFLSKKNKILNLDLDFFAPEMDYIDFDLAKIFVQEQARSANFITIATSPFFIEQEKALEVLKVLTK